MSKEFVKSYFNPLGGTVTMYQVDEQSYVIYSDGVPVPIFQPDLVSANYTFTYQKNLIDRVHPRFRKIVQESTKRYAGVLKELSKS